jgi:LytS/YehU family sensor histidine kinase
MPVAHIGNSIADISRSIWYLVLVIILLVLFTMVFIRWRLRLISQREKENNLWQQQVLQTEMRALRSQMNPHFIFNAINSIQHYVLTNEKELANKYLVKFSKLMRNILDQSKEELISLQDELETVKLYLEIESLRFNNAFQATFDIDDAVRGRNIVLPPLLIQPFAENAIWHGLLLKEGAKELNISIRIVNNATVIEIDDNGIGRSAAEKYRNKELERRSLGMEITQARLNLVRQAHGIFISFKITDKVDNAGTPLGTNVIIKIE